MQENSIENQRQIEQKLEQETFPEELSFFDKKISFKKTGKKLAVKKENGEIEIQVNTERFGSEQEAYREAVLESCYLDTLESQIQSNPDLVFKGRIKDQNLIKSLRLLSLQNLKTKNPSLAKEVLQIQEAGNSLKSQFEFACQQFLLGGNFPQNLDQRVQEQIKNLPSKNGKNVLEFIASGTYSEEAMAKMYRQNIAPIFKKLEKQEKESKQTKGDDYRPETGESNETPMEESEIENRVEPFFGGYYRGRTYHYNPNKLQITEDITTKETFITENPEALEGEKIRKFIGTFDPSKENVVDLPYDSLPLSDSLRFTGARESQEKKSIGGIVSGIKTKPPGEKTYSFQLMRDNQGVFSIEPVGEKPQQKVNFSFDFVIKKTEQNKLNNPPEEKNLETLGGNFDQETQKFLESLTTQKGLSTINKTDQIISFVRKKFKYPKNEEMNGMNSLYLSSGKNLIETICSHGVCDCHWSNIFAGEMLKTLGVPHRVPIGFFVQKDPRFDFAALAGTGHAWSEVWNGEEWLRFDATPAKENDEQDEENQEDQEENEGDYGESAKNEEKEELTPEEIEELYKELLESLNNEEIDPVAESFQREKGVSLEKWRKVESFIDSVNKTKISKEDSISGKETTFYDEWRNLFDLIYKRRELPVQAYRGPVRQSEGMYLDDPVDAYIDIKSGETDPFGYKIDAIKSREKIEVSEFEDDMILDLTGSMRQSGAYLDQKKMLLASSYNLMKLNDRLNLSYNKKNLSTPLQLKSRISSFKGTSTNQLHHSSEEKIDEKKLVQLYNELDNTERGTGNLNGALDSYKNSLTQETLNKIKKGKMTKVLTIISDGAVNNQSKITKQIQELREMGIVIQGIGFGSDAQDIKVICMDPKDPNAAVVIEDVSKAPSVRHKMLTKHLKKL